MVWPPPPCPVYQQQVIFKNSQTKNISDSSKVHFDKETVSHRDSVMHTTHLKSSVCVKIAPTNTNVSNVGQEKNIPTSCVDKQNGTTKGLPTPIRIDVLTELLSGYDQSTSKFLIDGFSKGFSLKCQKLYDDVTHNNHQSLYDEPRTASDLINKELSANRISGPFDKKPFNKFHVSPLKLQPKKEQGKFRLIHNLSAPYDEQSINFHISEPDSTVHYASIQDAISVIKKIGQHCFMAKSDIKSAFRLIPVSPNDYPRLGFAYKNMYYYDKCLAQGCVSSCQIF